MQFIHCHINALRSRVRASRDRRNGREFELSYRAGRMVGETMAHVIQQCFRIHGSRVKRHDCLTKFIAEAMTGKGWEGGDIGTSLHDINRVLEPTFSRQEMVWE